ncbi:MAG: adenosylcobinamide-GDP ribazoletransferase [Lachnospiraceae bacterium]|nr:adenosylcobinamide-GDP ribazoletransferase [Lachnospiraceae bacterium]MBR3468431.1 adenosylcobinamide-GDP ribazoletransferase [Lachnospiraceae bacterium]
MKGIKKIAKAFIVAFSIYSKIPMPRFTWESEDMKYHLCFFPVVGAVIGGAEFLWYFICCAGKDLGALPFTAVALAIPILITGGFHVDGFMDTCDALHSYQDREKKLEILKDPHIGAFAVICLAGFLLLAAGALSILYDAALLGDGMLWERGNSVLVLCLSFFLARTLSGISVVTMQGAKKKGMLQTFSDTAGKKTVLGVLIAELSVCCIGMILLQPILGLLSIAAAGASYAYYAAMSKKQFGGITGDLAGYFVSITELVVLCVGAIFTLIL